MKPFRFSFKDVAESGKSVKDYIAPPGFDFRYPNRFKSGNMYGCVSYLDILAPKFTDELIKQLLDIDANLTIHAYADGRSGKGNQEVKSGYFQYPENED